MASIILSSVGTSIGNMFSPGLGGKLLGALGRKLGHAVDQEIGWSASSSSDGERLENFKVQDSEYGVAIPKIFGQQRVSGNVIWVSDLIETSHKTSSGSAKGGVVSSVLGTASTNYTYSLNCAIALCEGEIGEIVTIWADSDVVYQDGAWADGVVTSATFYKGTKTQTVDPLLESWIGSGLCPAYRGMAYVVLEGLQLGDFGNRLPNLTFEVQARGDAGEAAWTGDVNPEISHVILSNKQGGMSPLVVAGSDTRASELIVGGYVSDGVTGTINIVRYDVTGDAPEELGRNVSAAFVCADPGDHSWAMASDGRYIAVGLQDGSSGYPYHVMIYDSASNVFGPVVSVSMLKMEVRQIAWIDAYRFVVTDYRDTKRGVRLFLRAGLNVIDCGFYDVWGSSTATTRVPVAYTQFTPYGDGLVMMMGDRALNFTALYGRFLLWQKNTLVVGDAFTVSSGYSVGSGSGPQVTLHKTGANEWTLFYLTLIDMQMMSMTLSASGVTVTRPWQKFTSSVFTSSASNVPIVVGDMVLILHRPSTESVYRMSSIALDEGCFTRVTDAVAVSDCVSASSSFNAVRVSGTRLLVTGNVGFAGALGQVGLIRTKETASALSSVVGALLERAGYEATDYDLSALTGTQVSGFVISKQARVASALEQLMMLAPFDLIESEGVLRGVSHGSGEVISVDVAQGCAGLSSDEDVVPSLVRQRTQDIDLPREVVVDYLDAARDYEVGAQRARRFDQSGAIAHVTLDLPIVLSAAQAKAIARRHLYALWIERDAYRLYVSRAYAWLEPGDVVLYDGIAVRLTQCVLVDGVLQLDGVTNVPDDLLQQTTSENGSGGQGSVAVPVASSLYCMDLPLLRAQDDQPGYYLAVSGCDGWSGADVWRSPDGVDFTRQTSLTTAAVAGVVCAVPGACSSLYPDTVSFIDVQLIQGSLSSCTALALYNGANVALCGAEILQFQTATLMYNGYYRLSGLLRGLKGTEDAIASHTVGESFVLLSDATVTFMPLQLTDRNVAYHYRAVSKGGSLGLAQDMTFTSGLQNLKPLAPVHVKGERISGGGLRLSWVRRARKNAAWVDYIDVPLDAEAELYDVTIYNGASVVREFTDLTSVVVDYTSAMMTADWGSALPTQVTFAVCQKSGSYGCGAVAQGVAVV